MLVFSTLFFSEHHARRRICNERTYVTERSLTTCCNPKIKVTHNTMSTYKWNMLSVIVYNSTICYSVVYVYIISIIIPEEWGQGTFYKTCRKFSAVIIVITLDGR